MKIDIGCLTNNSEILSKNLLRSPCVQSGLLTTNFEEGAPSAAVGYNRILDKSRADVIVLAHQDVYLPEGWENMLRERITEVEAIDSDWAVLGAFGIDREQRAWGPVWSSSVGQIIGQVPMVPKPIACVDEMLIVLRRAKSIRFDEGLPHFHFYGVDIVQIAQEAGLGTWCVSLPCIHNDGFKGTLDQTYDRCFHYIRRKWRKKLPLPSPTVKIAWHGLHLRAAKRRMKESFAHRESIARMYQGDPLRIAERCGWQKV